MMVDDEQALRLHDRAARGERLTDDERDQLESWYAVQDAAEARELGAASIGVPNLGEQIRVTLGEIAEVTRRVQQTVEDNDSLRREISGLRLKLAQQSARSG